jgi:phosphoribosyl 1,2-cyclic phosphodiesterase
MTQRLWDETPHFSIKFWGVRGTIPVSGADFNVFGGDTMCFEIRLDDQRIIVDAGSGLRRLGAEMTAAGTQEADILLTHLHLDHIIGLTVFEPMFATSGRVTVQAPQLAEGNLRQALGRLLEEPFFPVSMDRMPGNIACTSFVPGKTISCAGHRIRTLGLNHGIGASGYRFDHRGKALVIVTDYEHSSEKPDPELVALCKSADLIVYDAMWDEMVDFAQHVGWGHSSWQAGLRLVSAAGAARLACVHHAPAQSDTALAGREARLQALHPSSFFARQGGITSLLGQDVQST